METKKTLSKEDDSSLSVVEFLREVEEPLKETHLPLGKGKFIYTSLLGTADHLDTSDNIKAVILISKLILTLIVGGIVHGAGEHQNWKGEILPRHFYNQCKQALKYSILRCSSNLKIINCNGFVHNYVKQR